MTVHSFAEGIGIGVSFGGGESLGLVTAIAIHNIPEGLAISLVLVPRGVGVLRAAGWSVFSSLPQPLVPVPAFLRSAGSPQRERGLTRMETEARRSRLLYMYRIEDQAASSSGP